MAAVSERFHSHPTGRSATYQKIPGFHLIDREFVLTHDSSGHHPEDDLYRDLLPALGQMVR